MPNEEFVYVYNTNETSNNFNECENIYLNSLLVSKDNIKHVLEDEKQGCSCIGDFGRTHININGKNIDIYRIVYIDQYDCLQFTYDFMNYFRLNQINGTYYNNNGSIVAIIGNSYVKIYTSYLREYLDYKNLAILLYAEYNYFSNSFECEQIGLIEENDYIINQQCIKNFIGKPGYKIANHCVVKSILKI
ncbi:hypothetical protein AVBRAN12654_05490 [Campylobacter sp. RM12654]|uniref:hypothetical protein n=1 Tax=Campylobacter sp. RM12654 TaxID=2735738 RepID=UPI003014FEE6|nr:hypothetical protein [Campylobacter sp. RM12654]